jgi:hypothetical protein
MVAEVLKALVARNSAKKARGVLMPAKPEEMEAPSEEPDISDEDMAALLEMGEDEDKMEA